MISALRQIGSCLLIGGFCLATASGAEEQRLLLRGRPSVCVYTWVSKNLASSVTREQIAMDAELALRQNEIPVFDHPPKCNSALTLDILAAKDSVLAGYAVYLRAELLQDISLLRGIEKCEAINPSLVATCLRAFYSGTAGTWSDEELSIRGSATLTDLRKEMGDLVKKFVLAYLRANEGVPKTVPTPKQQPTTEHQGTPAPAPGAHQSHLQPPAARKVRYRGTRP